MRALDAEAEHALPWRAHALLGPAGDRGCYEWGEAGGAAVGVYSACGALLMLAWRRIFDSDCTELCHGVSWWDLFHGLSVYTFAYADLPPSSTQTHLFAEIQQLAHSFAAPHWCRGRSTARHGGRGKHRTSGLPFFPTHFAAEIKKLMQSLLILHFPVNRLHTRVLAYGQREELEDGEGGFSASWFTLIPIASVLSLSLLLTLALLHAPNKSNDPLAVAHVFRMEAALRIKGWA
ncbi:hypothetical protein C8J57DRAFT_1258141 [Mycena rebaudengoi]|nr:hypothetical protein C8J57DRAFT_1258141 [Mycena rebaudengoi]